MSEETNASRRSFLKGAVALGGIGLAMPFAGLPGTEARLLRSLAPQARGTLTVAIANAIDTLDPAAEQTVIAQTALEMMAERLVGFDQKGHLRPLLATSWSNSSDAKTWSLTLRKGVKFHNGESFNANAVKFNFERLLSPNTTGALPGQFTAIEAIDVIDDYHVRFHLSLPFAGFLPMLTLGVGAQIAPGSVNLAPNTPKVITQPVGTGPYVFKEHVKGSHLTMTRNAGYWGKKPAYSTQVYMTSTDATAREALLRSGQADVLQSPPLNDVAALTQDQSLRILKAYGPWSTGVIINTQSSNQPLLKNATVRQALNYAVDKKTIIKSQTFGLAYEVDSPFPKTLQGYCSTGHYPFNQAKARSMLKAAGADGMTVKMISQAATHQLGEVVANYLEQVGVKVDLPNPVDSPTFLSLTDVPPAKCTIDMFPGTFASGDLDGSRMMDDFKPVFPPANALNLSYYDNAKVGELINKGNGDPVTAHRNQAYCQAENTIWTDAPWIFLYSLENVLAVSKKVKNVYYLPNNYFVTTWASPAS